MVHAFACGPVSTNCYVVTNTEDGIAFLVDCPPDSHDKVMRVLETHQCTLTDILLTHTHWDHTADCLALQNSTGANLWVHPNDAYRLIDPMRYTVWPLPFEIQPATNFNLLEINSLGDTFVRIPTRIQTASFTLRVIETPGHTEGGVCFVDDVEKLVFAGDTIFLGSVGRTDLPGGDMSVLVNSIRNSLFTMDDDYTLLPGHGPQTTIGHERNTNLYVGENAR